jgi:muramoyltetrapeptide carboxypeptidase
VPAAGLSAPRRRELLKPPRLRAGDLVGLVSPAGVLDDASIQRRVKNIESLGFRVKVGDNLRAKYGGYAGTPLQRASDLHRMFEDRDVRGIWAARGGSGCLQLLPVLDYALVRRNAKVLVGFSDITALHLAFLHRAGLVTFHGPTAGSTFSDYSVANLRAVLMEPGAPVSFQRADEHVRREAASAQYRPRTIVRGQGEGPLWGGNLSLVAAMMGTPYLPGAAGAVVFLEDVGEAPYRVDRMLTQLRLAGTLPRAAGVMLGIFERGEAKDDEPQLTLREAIDDNMGATVPAAYGFSFGHVAHQVTLPLGIRARVDADTHTVTLLENAVT